MEFNAYLFFTQYCTDVIVKECSIIDIFVYVTISVHLYKYNTFSELITEHALLWGHYCLQNYLQM